MMMMMLRLLALAPLLLRLVASQTDRIIGSESEIENGLINQHEIFDFAYSEDSNVFWTTANTTKYYCVYRNLWTKIDHPVDYPDMARLSDIPIYSSTKQFLPWLKDEKVTYGVEKLAESGFTDFFKDEIKNAGPVVLDIGEGKAGFLNQEKWEENYYFLPGVAVNQDYPFLNGLAGILPSPDWFTGFYLFDTIDDQEGSYYNRFVIKTYPWDAGTDDGKTYMDTDRDLFAAENIQRFTPQSTDNGIFVSPEGVVKPVAEWECILHVCPLEEPDCEMENWPPADNCDYLKNGSCDNADLADEDESSATTLTSVLAPLVAATVTLMIFFL